MFGTKWDAAKLKPRLKMATHRLQIATNKKSALMKQQKREIAKLLAEEPLPKEEKARIRAEALIRDDNTIEAYEILQLECELIHERIKLLNSTKHCPADMASCIATLIYASDRVDVIELTEIRKQFRAKYGKDFEQGALANTNGILNERVVAKLSVHPPTAILVNAYLEKIAEEYEVDWKAKPLQWEDQMQPTAAPQGHSVGIAAGSGLGRAVTGISHLSIMEPGDGDGSQQNSNRSNNDNDSYNGGCGGGGIPMGSVDKPAYDIPIVEATAYNPPYASAPSQSERNLGDTKTDADIYVPVPMNFPSSSQNNNNNYQDDVVDGSSTIASSEGNPQYQEQDNNKTSGGKDGKANYDSLAARFANLKR